MLNHDLARYFFAITTMAVVGCCWVLGWNWLWCLVPVGLFVANLVYGTFDIRANYHLKSINSGDLKSNKIALTFDDGPTEFTPDVLDILKKHGTRATFFCIGNRLNKSKEIVQRAFEEGHTFGNHSYVHSQTFDFASTSKVVGEIEQTNALLKSITGHPPRWFRPPFGVTNPNIRKALVRTEMQSIGWTNRSLDTLNHPPEKVVSRVMRKLQGGDIILFHDSHDRISPILEQFLDEVSQTDFQIVPLEELIDEKSYS